MIPYTAFTMPNGLRVVHSFDPLSAMAAIVVLYDAGARDETPSLTGLAHLSEHLMFSTSSFPDSFDNLLEAAGGSSNAATGNDFTEFHCLLPAQNAETAFCLESGRMQSLDLSPKALEVQKSVVIEEFKQTCLNRPYGRMMHVLRPMLYGSHPYRWPVIGIEPAHIERVQLADAIAWHASRFAPGNAVLGVCGGISLEQARQWAEKWFAAIPARPVPARSLPDDPWPTVPQRADITDRVPQTAILMGWRMPAYGQPGYFAADAITDILSAGKSSRMHRRLVMESGLFNVATASILGSEHSGLLIAMGYINASDDASVQRACEMLEHECRQLAIEGNVTADELQLTKNRYHGTTAFENVSLLTRTQNLAMAVMHGEDINMAVPRYSSLTLEQIRDAARLIFIDHAPATVVCRPTS